MRTADGRAVPLSASIRPFLTHKKSRPFYDGKASFEVTEMSFQTSIGTYIDSPRHRFQGHRDIAQLSLDELVLEGLVVHVLDARAGETVGLDRMPMPDEVCGDAVLFRFDWDRHWGTETYGTYPHIGMEVIEYLVAGGATLVGMDTLNADDHTNPKRPCHTQLLGNNILIVENLTNLAALLESGFRFFAIPIKAKDTAAMTIRAFAEIPAQ